jgi:hypothetical protein
VEPVEAVLLLVAVGLAAALVLRDIAAYERPPREKPAKPVKAAKPAKPVKAAKPPRERAPERVREPAGGGNVRVSEPARVAHGGVAYAEPRAYDGSMLGAIAATEHDEHSAARRVLAALVLLTLTLLTAGLVGAGIYRGLQSFAK